MPSYSNYPSGFTQAFCSMLVSNIHMKCVLHITLEQQQRRRRRQSSGERGRSEPEKKLEVQKIEKGMVHVIYS